MKKYLVNIGLIATATIPITSISCSPKNTLIAKDKPSMLAILVASPTEINKFKFELLESKKINQFKFKIYKIGENKVVFVHSGIGIANSAAATQELISSFNIDEIYNYGAVGGDSNVKVFDIITPKYIYYHDVVTPWAKRGTTPYEKEHYINNIQLKNNKNLASGSSFLDNEDHIKNIQKDIDVNIFDMETAAIAQICEKNNVKLNVIKCVSDSIGVDPTKLAHIKQRIKKAGRIAFEKTIELIKSKILRKK